MDTIYKEKIPSTDPRLKRIVYHDSRSRNFAFNTAGLEIKSIKHNRHIGILNQGQLGSCTGNAGIGDLATDPLFATIPIAPKYTLDELGAVKLYSDAEKLDGGVGYPPEDNGSSGLSIAKVLKNAGVISGYQHTFTLYDALKAGSVYPFITGINWYTDMFNPDPDGRVHPTGTIAGGHEVQLSEIDVLNGKIWFFNSWGEEWGLKGRFYLTWADYATLLSQYGDVTVLLPISGPIPPPAPIVTPTAVLTRTGGDTKETFGTLTASMGGATFTCKTLELPKGANIVDLTCIPAGTYKAVYTFWPAKGVYHYLLQGVPGRTGIFIHAGNYNTDTKGCILLGASYADINKDGEPDIITSMTTVKAFEDFMGHKTFELTII